LAIAAITFDYWNTLMFEVARSQFDRRLNAWLGLLDGAGFATEQQHLTEVFDSVIKAHTDAWRRNEQFTAAEGAAHALELLGYHVPADLHDELLETFLNAGRDAILQPTECIGETLVGLRERDVRIGIICDVGFTPSTHLREHLSRHGLLDHFDGWSFSDEVGVYKPSPVIFHHAMSTLGVSDPSTMAHIGDLRRTDVAGARAMGMTSVRYAGVFDDPGTPEEHEEGDVVIAHYSDLLPALGLA